MFFLWTFSGSLSGSVAEELGLPGLGKNKASHMGLLQDSVAFVQSYGEYPMKAMGNI